MMGGNMYGCPHVWCLEYKKMQIAHQTFMR